MKERRRNGAAHDAFAAGRLLRGAASSVVKRRAHQSGLYARLQTADHILVSGWLPASIFGGWIPSPALGENKHHRRTQMFHIRPFDNEEQGRGLQLLKYSHLLQINHQDGRKMTEYWSLLHIRETPVCCKVERPPSRKLQRFSVKATHTWTHLFIPDPFQLHEALAPNPNYWYEA